MSILGPVATDGGLSHKAICPLRKDLWLVARLGIEHRRVVITLADGHLDLGEGGDHFG
jgi:hypothetical protein